MAKPVFAAAGLAAALLCVPAAAQEPAAEAAASSDSQVIEEVVVRGRRMGEIEDDLRIEIGKFIDEVVVLPTGRGFARWQGRVCVGVHNLERTAGQYLVDRISALALEVGLAPGEPGCNPDVVIIFTADGKETASYIVENHAEILRPTGDSGQHRGLAALDEFTESDRAVRWWHLSLPVDARTGAPAIRQRGQSIREYPTVAVDGPSRIHDGIRDAMQRVVIVVDSSKLTGTTWQQLGDYLAVVSLAQVDLDTDPAAFDSILNLFNNPKAYSGLTDWDRSYVSALYGFDQRRIPSLQASEIVSQMVQREIENGAQ
jgi:hypothetical protein